VNADAGSKLKEANDQQQFNRNVEDIEVWLGEIEGQLMSEDYGKASNYIQTISPCCAYVVLDYVSRVIGRASSLWKKLQL